MPRADIENADKRRKILAYIKSNFDSDHYYAILWWNDADSGWQNSWTTGADYIDNKRIVAWDYVFEPPVEKSSLRNLYDKYNNDITTSSSCRGYWELMDAIIQKIEELDGRDN